MPKSRIFSQYVPFHATSPAVFFPATQHFVATMQHGFPDNATFPSGVRTWSTDVTTFDPGVATFCSCVRPVLAAAFGLWVRMFAVFVPAFASGVPIFRILTPLEAVERLMMQKINP